MTFVDAKVPMDDNVRIENGYRPDAVHVEIASEESIDTIDLSWETSTNASSQRQAEGMHVQGIIIDEKLMQ